MKKLYGILLSILIFLAGMHLSVASHYCGGREVASKISFSRDLASCGMEKAGVIKAGTEVFRKHCCEDIVSPVSISSVFFPTFYSPVNYFPVISCELIPVVSVSGSYPVFLVSGGSVKPPGDYCPENVEQQVICIFRI